mgnify:CR=1 FL=1
MKKLFAMTVAVLLLFSVLLGIPAAYGQAPETGKTLDILFSHDTHSHLNTFTTVVRRRTSAALPAPTPSSRRSAPKTRTPL